MPIQTARILKVILRLSLLLSCLLAPDIVLAVSIWIDDHTDSITVRTDPENAELQIIQEGQDALGEVNWVFSYLSNDPNVPTNNAVFYYYYNIFEPDGGGISDTLRVQVGRDTTPGSNANVIFQLNFISGSTGSLEVNILPNSDPLIDPPGAVSNLDECQGRHIPDCSSEEILRTPVWIDIGVNGNGQKPLSDLNIHISSASVPEPTTMSMLAIGLIAFGYSRRRAMRR